MGGLPGVNLCGLNNLVVGLRRMALSCFANCKGNGIFSGVRQANSQMS